MKKFYDYGWVKHLRVKMFTLERYNRTFDFFPDTKTFRVVEGYRVVNINYLNSLGDGELIFYV